LVNFPPDNGASLIQAIQQWSNILYAASDASLKDGQSTHAWLLSMGQISNIEDNTLTIYSSSPVDGFSHLSSARAELHGIMAISIIAKPFLSFYSSSAKIITYCNNKGMINKCNTLTINSLQKNRETHWVSHCVSVL